MSDKKMYFINETDCDGCEYHIFAQLTEEEAKNLKTRLSRGRRWPNFEEIEFLDYKNTRAALGLKWLKGEVEE